MAGGGRSFRGANVILNVYDLSPVNSYSYEFGVGAFHSGVEVGGTEYTFGGHATAATGIFTHAPRQAPGATLRTSIDMGETDKSSSDIRAELSSLGDHFRGNTYHLVLKNCNHFSNELCLRLIGRPIPSWVNRLAYLGSWVSCILPKDLGVHHPDAPDVQSQSAAERYRSSSVRSFTPFAGQGVALSSFGQPSMSAGATDSAVEDVSDRRSLLAAAALKRFAGEGEET